MNTALFEFTAEPNDRRRLQARARRLTRRVQALVGEGRMDEALVCQVEVVELRPDDPQVYLQLGFLYHQLSKIDAALMAFRYAAVLEPNHRLAREILIDTLLGDDRFDEVISEARALLKLAPRSLYARDALSVAFLHTGDLPQAMRMTNEMIHLDPRDPEHIFKRAILHQQLGQLAQAVADYERVLESTEPGSGPHDESESALEALDESQLREIVLLAADDRAFRIKLDRDAPEAVQQRGYCLSADTLAHVRAIVEAATGKLAIEDLGLTPSGTIRLYA